MAMRTSKETVFVTDGQLRSALSIVRSLGRRNIRLVCGESTRFATTFFSRYVDETVVYPDPESNPKEFSLFLERFLASRDIDALLPVGQETTALVSEGKATLSRYTNVPVIDYGVFERANDKSTTLRLAERLGVPHPRTAHPASIAEATDVAESFEFPVIIKPRVSSGSRGLRLVRSRDDFESTYSAVYENYPCPLIQEYIPRPGRAYGDVGACFLYNRDGEVRAQFVSEFLREFPLSGGPSTFHRSIAHEEALEYGCRLLDELDWRGVAMVEFRIDPRDGQPKLLEINPRFWSSLELSVRSGVDFPWLVLQHAYGRDPPATMDYTVGIQGRYLLPGDVLHLLAVHDLEGVREFFPLRDDNIHYEVLSRSDIGPTVGRLAAMARFAVSPAVWRKAIFRN